MPSRKTDLFLLLPLSRLALPAQRDTRKEGWMEITERCLIQQLYESSCCIIRTVCNTDTTPRSIAYTGSQTHTTLTTCMLKLCTCDIHFPRVNPRLNPEDDWDCMQLGTHRHRQIYQLTSCSTNNIQTQYQQQDPELYRVHESGVHHKHKLQRVLSLQFHRSNVLLFFSFLLLLDLGCTYMLMSTPVQATCGVIASAQKNQAQVKM